MAAPKKQEKSLEPGDEGYVPQRGEEGFVEPDLTAEQTDQLGEGRRVAKDRTERKSAKPDTGRGFESPTPSALALEKVGEDGDGEKYQAEKRKHRWG